MNTREQWLTEAVTALTDLFSEHGHTVPPTRVSVGFPGGRGVKSHTIGQCWAGAASSDGVGQMFISPVLDDAPRVLDVLAHELIHAINFAAGKTGHGSAFRKIAVQIGLTGKMTATVAGPELADQLRAMAAALGEYPHAALTPGTGITKQTTRMLKVVCAEPECCEYVVRMTRKWLDEVGAPYCPCGCDQQMTEAD